MKLPIVGQVQPGADGRDRWRSLEEREGRSRHPAEFRTGAAEAPEGLSRRGFLQILGASVALAGLEGCKPPRDKIHPYVRAPEKAPAPGAELHYATAAALGAYATGLLVTSHEGRPTKVEGNPDHPSSLGASGTFEQALLLDLYDPRRLRGFQRKGQPVSFRGILQALAELAAAHAADGGARLRFLLPESASPLLAELRSRIQARFPRARFHVFESLSSDQAREGARLAFGRPMETRLRLDGARVILSLDDDFLAFGPERLRLAREFAARRTPGPEMSRLYVAEAHLSLTGAVADHRLRMKPSEVLGFARGVARALAERPGMASLAPLGAAAPAGREAAAVAADLARAGAAAVITVGPRQPPAVHALAHALNAALGSAGRLVELRPAAAGQSGPASLRELAAAAAAGQVDTLVITARNPAYTAPADLDLGAALAQVPNTLYLAARPDETSGRASWVLAAAHPFESWGDARAADGSATLCQPLISPLFESLSEVDLLAAFVDQADQGAYRLLKDLWAVHAARTGALEGFDATWEGWLGRGVVPGTAQAPETPAVRPEAVAAALQAAPAAREGIEASFVPDYKVYDGRFAENAWMQELPDPVTKMTWDNAALLSPATARRLNLVNGSRVELRLRGRKVEAPVWTVPGHADDVITLPLGYGRTVAGPAGTHVGFDAGRLRGAEAPWFDGGLALAPVGRRKHAFAVTQEHFSMEGREIALSFDQAAWSKEKVEHLHGPLPTLHAPVDYGRELKWGMAIDLTKCIGCSACVTACQAENNIPVVGKERVRESREMHWLRIDRYFSGDPQNPEVLTQPVACVHCEMAPCEYVCPVNATVHSDEGLNEMVYNRCVGTRYCSNNCPYKVRRFNFFEYNKDKAPTEKMLMNPDVTVRHRGVMEKCTYCVQRIERHRIAARVEGRDLRDGEITTACQQACPAQAIAFGNLNDPKAQVTAWHRDERRYDLLHEVGTRPRTAYLVRIRNPNPELA